MRVSICSIAIAFFALSAAAVVEGQEAADKYLMLAAERTTTMQREISEAAGDGYSIVPRGVARKGDELLVLMEKGPGGPSRSQYQVVGTDRTGTLQKEITQASNDGFTLVAVARTGEPIAILERPAP